MYGDIYHCLNAVLSQCKLSRVIQPTTGWGYTFFFRTATDGTDTEHARVGGLWLVRSHSSFLFDTCQPLLVDFDFCFATIRSPDAVVGF